MNNSLIEIKDLVVNFYTEEGVVKALNHINLDIMHKETLGLVGETGCGKTMTALSILRLVPNPGQIDSGSILFKSNGSGEVQDLLKIPESQMRRVRGSSISMVFQEPGSALNPVYTIGNQIAEVLILHRLKDVARQAINTLDSNIQNGETYKAKLLHPFRRFQKILLQQMISHPHSVYIRFLRGFPVFKRFFYRLNQEAEKMAAFMLKEVDIPDAERIVRYFPHQLSGGMKQRAVIAMALACSPRFLIADEPTTALDVTIQAQILDLLRRLKEEFESSVLYITHDLGVAASICDRVGVMYAGSICELANVDDLYARPLHPYTQALLAAVPKPGEEPKPIPGFIPDPTNPPSGCQFHPRCPRKTEKCIQMLPPLQEVEKGHFVACHTL